MLVRKMAVALAVAGSLGVAPNVASADPLAPASTIAGPSTTMYFGGMILASVEDCFVNLAFGGCARAAVVRSAGNTLDFYYQFTHDGGSPIERQTAFDFGGFSTDVYQISNGSALGVANFMNGTVSSVDATRSAAGSTVGWNYALGTMVGGTTSVTFVIRTDAVNYTSGLYNQIDGAVNSTTAFAPSSAVPEPATMILLGSGILGLAIARRRRNTSV